MTPDDALFDQRISDWLEADPDAAPPVVLEAIIAAAPSIPQRRSRRTPWLPVLVPLPRRAVWIAVAAAVALIALALLSGVGRTTHPPVSVVTPPSPAVSSPAAVVATSSASATRAVKPSPTVSPLLGAGAIVFEHFTAGVGTRIEALQTNGLGKELLPRVAGDQERPAWSADGRRLAFAGRDPRDAASREAIYETDASGATPTLVTVDCSPPACLEEWDPSYSTDGTKMVFVRSAGKATGPPSSTVVAIRDLATGAVTTLEATRIKGDVGFVDHPSLSPDGRRVVYARMPTAADGSTTDSVVMTIGVDGGTPTALTPDGWEAGDSSWSADGTRILFAREPMHYWFGGGKGAGQNTFIYTMAADGSDVTQLTDFGPELDEAGSPSWTAGGAQILFAHFPVQSIGTPDFDVMAADGSQRASIARYGDCCRWYPVQQPTP